MTRALDLATYPSVVLLAIAVQLGLLAVSAPPPAAAYGAVAVGAVAIVALEAVRPHRRAWRPERSTVVADGAFLVVVQMLLPFLASSAVVFVTAELVDGQVPGTGGLWPHGWPTLGQVVLMLVVGDFFRYWLHRAFHADTRLWRLHAVHHSPHGLYWLNVGRFHPLEKAVQLLVDSLPFVVLGVDRRVLAGYFVFYAVNGFFQHSNCRVRLGWGNYVLSGPELHRWHHSRRIEESDHNFGNNLIVWDVLFGTRFLPSDRQVEELGLLNRQYPTGFGSQLLTPFRPDLDKAPSP
ncbi:MAG: sterol desaturase family protein [Actinomycetota bacterium]